MLLWQANKAPLKDVHILMPDTEPVKMLCYSSSGGKLIVTKSKFQMEKQTCKARYKQNIHGKEVQRWGVRHQEAYVPENSQ